jgi:hypothetical protein
MALEQLKEDCAALERKHPDYCIVAFRKECTADEVCVAYGMDVLDALEEIWGDEDGD